MSNISAILFDFDGILVQLDYTNWEHQKDKIGEYFTGYKTKYNRHDMVGSLISLNEELGGELNKIVPTVQNILDYMEHEEVARVNDSTILSGAKELLSFCADNKIPWAIVSNNSLSVIYKVLEYHHLPPPKVIIGRSGVTWKPCVTPVRKALVGLKFLSEDGDISNDNIHDTVYIGDRLEDLECSHALRLHTIMVNTKWSFSDKFLFRPVVVAKDNFAVLEYLNWYLARGYKLCPK